MASRRLAMIVVVAMACAGCGWTQLRGNAAHTGQGGIGSGIDVENVSTLTQAWMAPIGTNRTWSPAVADGVVYVAATEANDGALYAFDATGGSGCSGTPKTCAPLWTAPSARPLLSAPTVAGGAVYVIDSDGTLSAFDAAGVRGCSGTPKTCAPLWTAWAGGDAPDAGESPPAVAGGVVYVSTEGVHDRLYAFDAAGATNCSGTPTTCDPLWTAPGAGGTYSPAVSDGLVYVNVSGGLGAFDAAGAAGCSGTPKACTPLWTYPGGATGTGPAVADGLVYANVAGEGIKAFDAAGETGCFGTPKACVPLWTAASGGTPSVANGVVYAGAAAYDAAGLAGCSGAPTKTCVPRWTYLRGASDEGAAVTDGVVYAPSDHVYAYDAAGSKNCWFTPKLCAPLWASPVTAGAPPVITNGFVYVLSGDGDLYAFRP